jgi:predicted nucleotidyltransferase
MTRKTSPQPDAVPPRWYRGKDIPMRVIRCFARAVAEQFQPEKIILFGSYAYGTPHDDSDVDILVVMPTRNEIDQAVKICLAIPAPFPMDLIVRTPKDLRWRLEEGDSFLREIVARGKVLYAQADAGVGTESVLVQRERELCLRGVSVGKGQGESLITL